MTYCHAGICFDCRLWWAIAGARLLRFLLLLSLAAAACSASALHPRPLQDEGPGRLQQADLQAQLQDPHHRVKRQGSRGNQVGRPGNQGNRGNQGGNQGMSDRHTHTHMR